MPDVSPFDFARLAALKQYSDLEFELCHVLRYALGVDAAAGAAVFYGISNTRARYAMISNLLRQRHKGAYRKAWSKIEGWVGPCDGDRNQLIHWAEDIDIIISFTGEDDLRETSIYYRDKLKNPTGLWQQNDNAPKIYERDVWEKRDKMRVLMHIVNRFGLTLHKPKSWPWTDIFRQPIEDRCPTAFLQRLNHAGCEAQLPPYDQKLLKSKPVFPPPEPSSQSSLA